MSKFKVILAGVVLVLLATASRAVLVQDMPVTLIQPDGQSLSLLLTGDEFHHRVYDKNGYTVVKDPASGFLMYATKEAGRLVPGKLVAGRDDPSQSKLQPGLDDDPELLRAEREALPYMSNQGAKTPSTGEINNLVVFIRFADQSEYTDSLVKYDRTFNDSTGGVNSLRNYFNEASYGNLTVRTALYPLSGDAFIVSYQDSYNRSYYCPYDSVTAPDGYTGGDNGTMRRDREHILLKNAVEAVASQVPSGLDIDADSDGYVDNVCFIIQGTTTAWATLLWSHRWALYSQSAYINSKRVWDYNFQMESQFNVGVLCHEMGHSVGYPDLYHYYYSTSLSPASRWDVMCSAPNPPEHSSSYMKYYYTGWVSNMPEITESGTYWLNYLASGPNKVCYKIASANSDSEYYVLEYRLKTGIFENSLYGSGLLVWRVNSRFAGEGNAYYDGSTIFDELYLYRPNGTVSTNGDPTTACFSSGSGRTAINDGTNPSGFLYDGSPGGLDIYDIGATGDSICFTVAFPTGVAGDRPGTQDLSKGLRFLSCGPNPARNSVNLDFLVERGSDMSLDIYRVNGQQVASIKLGSEVPGRHRYVWNLRDERGQKLAAGVYILQLVSAGERATGRLVIIK
jgi:M6 family metalloprotease-like protein